MTEYAFVDDSGQERLHGTIVPDPGVSISTREQVGGNAVNIADAANALLTWDTSGGPDTLLDLAVPTVPAVVTAGVYAVTVGVTAAAITAGGTYIARLELDQAGDDYSFDAQATGPAVRTALAATIHLPAGAAVTLTVFNFDGAAARDFTLAGATVQRLS